MKCFVLLTLTEKPHNSWLHPPKTPILMNSPRSHLLHVHRITSSGTCAGTADIGEILQRCRSETCIPQLLAEHFELFLTVWTCSKFSDILGKVRSDFYVNTTTLAGNIPGLCSCARATLVRIQDRLISCCFSISCLVTLSLSLAEMTNIPWNLGVIGSKSRHISQYHSGGYNSESPGAQQQPIWSTSNCTKF